MWIKILLYTSTLYVLQFSEATFAPEGPGGHSVQSVHFSIVIMGEESELQAKVVALINRQLGDSLAGAPFITAFRDELEAKRRCVETRYEPPKYSFASAEGFKQGCGSGSAFFSGRS